MVNFENRFQAFSAKKKFFFEWLILKLTIKLWLFLKQPRLFLAFSGKKKNFFCIHVVMGTKRNVIGNQTVQQTKERQDSLTLFL